MGAIVLTAVVGREQISRSQFHCFGQFWFWYDVIMSLTNNYTEVSLGMRRKREIIPLVAEVLLLAKLLISTMSITLS